MCHSQISPSSPTAMGIPLSLMKTLGFSSATALSTDKIFDQFFNKNICTFEEFHISFVDACNKFNLIMPGDRYRAPKIEKIKEYYNRWKEQNGVDEKKKILVELLTGHLTIAPPDNVIVMTGVLAPPAAMILKRAGDSVPQLNKFRLNLIPDMVFIPSMTCVALIAAKVLRMNASNDA